MLADVVKPAILVRASLLSCLPDTTLAILDAKLGSLFNAAANSCKVLSSSGVVPTNRLMAPATKAVVAIFVESSS